MEEFVPTLGNLIGKLDDILKHIPPQLQEDYAKLFDGTEIQKLLFSSETFKEEASEYCREAGWSEPK